MTTTVKVHVNGRYRATVEQYGNGKSSKTVIDGNYDGSPNPTGEGTFYVAHGDAGQNKFKITEEAVPMPEAASKSVN